MVIVTDLEKGDKFFHVPSISRQPSVHRATSPVMSEASSQISHSRVDDVLSKCREISELINDIRSSTKTTTNAVSPSSRSSSVIAERGCVGLILRGNKVEEVVQGGPAFYVGCIAAGDSIVKVVGCEGDVSTCLDEGKRGSVVELLVQKASLGGKEAAKTMRVDLRRVTAEEISSRREVHEALEGVGT
eukprot:767785-Hanusia_phi.AAC.8